MKQIVLLMFKKLPLKTQVIIEKVIELIWHGYTGKITLHCHKGSIGDYNNEP